MGAPTFSIVALLTGVAIVLAGLGLVFLIVFFVYRAVKPSIKHKKEKS
jgi:hypothetical protein